MKRLHGVLYSLLLSATVAHADIGPVRPLQRLNVTSGPVILQASGLPELPRATYLTTQLAPAQAVAFASPTKASNLRQHDDFFGDYVSVLVPNGGHYRGELNYKHFLIAEAFAGSDGNGGITTPTTIYIGIDRNADGLPEQNEVLCQADFAADTKSASCLADVSNLIADAAGPNFWIAVRLPPNYVGYTASNDYAILPGGIFGNPIAVAEGSNGQTVVTGPGHAAAGASFPLRLSPAAGSFPFPATQTLYGALLVDTAAAGQGQAGVLPFALTRSIGNDNNNVALTVSPLITSNNADPSDLHFTATPVAPGETLQRWFFDLPPITDGSQYGTLSVVIYDDNVSYYSDLQYGLVRADFPGASTSPVIAPAPDLSDAIALDASYDGPATNARFNLTPGRWYVVVHNQGSSEHKVSVSLTNGYVQDINLLGVGGPYFSTPSGPRLGAGANPTIAPGMYYNPQRSGHGVAISQAGGQQMLFWFTYLEDGTPTWYQAQAPAPDAKSGWWSSPLYRVAWDGAKAHLTPVGSITLTPTSANRFMFTWNLEGQSGSEAFNQLARFGDCPALNGAPTNLDGAWYAPTLSGYGMQVLALPEQQFNLFFFYDELGIARWGVGNTGPFSAASTFDFRQNSGFCPSCTYTPVTYQALGTATIDFSDAGSGTLSTAFALQPPLSGTWVTSRPMVRLTGSAACSP